MKLKWNQAPVKTQWGHDMVVADVAIDKDHTVSLYCEREQTAKVEAMFAQPAQPAQQQELEELTAQRDQLADILTRTANALKGQPAELSLHSWHDLPEVAQQLRAAQQQEPVAWIVQYAHDHKDIDFYEQDIEELPIGTKLYTSPQPAQQQCMEHGECFGGECIYPAPQPAQPDMKQEIITEAAIQMSEHPSKDARWFAKSVYEYLMAEQPAPVAPPHEQHEPDLTEQGRTRSAILGNNVEAMMDVGLSFFKALETTLKVYDHDTPKIGCVNHDCDKCKAQQQEPVAERFEKMHANGDVWITTIAAAAIARNTPPQPAQEPVAHMNVNGVVRAVPYPWGDKEVLTPLYPHPPASKPWVGLTDEERKEIYRQAVYVDGAIRMTEAKLREKNNG